MSSKTHRCIDCPHIAEHLVDELCPSCGRCSAHCQADNHLPMAHARFRVIGEGDAATMQLLLPADYPRALKGPTNA